MSLYFEFGCSMLSGMIALIDSNIWGFLAIPVGLLVCFGPALLVWLKAECSSSAPEDRRGDL
jgi:hypothetical protein